MGTYTNGKRFTHANITARTTNSKPATNRRKVICITNEIIYSSINEASKELNVSQSSIVKSAKNNIPVKGLIFKYITNKTYLNND